MVNFRLLYAHLGWPILPLHYPRAGVCTCRARAACIAAAKHPAVAHGVYNATTDAETIERWWAHFRWNIGIATGHGFWVMDVDPRSGGEDTLAALERQHGPLPNTPRSLTGGGGVHYLFRLPEGVRLKGSVGPGLDVKSTGGFVVAPPSLHASGRRYAWDLGALPSETPLVDAPAWLLDLAVDRTAARSYGPAVEADCFVASAFRAAGMLGDVLPGGRTRARCPWAREHTGGGDGGDSSAAVMPPTSEAHIGAFRCLHAHCSGRRTDEALAMLPKSAMAAAAAAFPQAFKKLVWRLAEREVRHD